MSYAGRIGPPGRYNVEVDLLVDPLGHHPGEPSAAGAAPVPPPATPIPAPATAITPDQSAATALAPQTQSAAQTQEISGPGTKSPWSSVGLLMLTVAIVIGGIFVGLQARRASAVRRKASAGFPLRLPDHLISDARRLAAASGTPLDQFLATLIAERIGELKATKMAAGSPPKFGT
jgi:hypothetical protein